jgi:phage-related protein
MDEPKRPLIWMGNTLKALRSFPEEVRGIVGYALYLAQHGDRHPRSKVLRGFGSGGMLEVLADHDGDAYRVVYTVRFRDSVYVLHAFQKKSKRGIATPMKDLELIRHRLGQACDHHRHHQDLP